MLHRSTITTGIVILSDIVLINLAFALSYWIRYDLQWLRAVEPAFDVPLMDYLPFSALLTVLLIGTFLVEGVYHRKRTASWFDEAYAIFNGTTTAIIIMMALVFFFVRLFYSRLIFLYAGTLIILILGVSRLALRQVEAYLRQKGVGVARVLIVGAGETGRTVLRTLVAHPSLGYEIAGFVDDDPSKGETDIGRFKALGGLENLPKVIQQEAVDEVIITLPWQYHRKILSIMTQCEREHVRSRIVPDLFQIAFNRMEIINLAGIPLISVKEVSISRAGRAMKRAIDLLISAAALTFLAPIMALIALAIKLDSPGPVFFKQKRVGKGGRLFTLYKFRSMVEEAEEMQEHLIAYNEAEGPLFKIRDDPRRTRVGRLLRRFSLDELPQFYNVFRGDMSVVGPRPPVPSEVEQYNEWHKRRLDVAPGITGLWQVSGRSDLSFDEMALLDIYYIENWSPSLDTKIFLQTIPRVILGRGAY